MVIFTMTLRSAAAGQQSNNTVGKSNNWDMQHGWLPREPSYQGRSLSDWLKAIHDRDEDMMPLAFEAIRSLGPDAWAAVPELKRVVAAPFAPIQL